MDLCSWYTSTCDGGEPLGEQSKIIGPMVRGLTCRNLLRFIVNLQYDRSTAYRSIPI